MNLHDVYNNYSADVQEAQDFCNSVYDAKFREEFSGVYELKSKMKDAKSAITDDELEEILTTLPLQLFTISEILNSVKLERETIQLKMKDYKHRRIVELTEGEMYSVSGVKMSATEKKEWVTKSVNAEMTDHELLLSAYDSIIDRVEREISMSRELIMGAKKIWDGRRATENVNPIGPVVTPDADLPDYVPNQSTTKTYIK